MILRRRFADLIERQLDLFEQDNGDLLRQIDDAEEAYDAAGSDEAEERFGDLADLVEEGTEILVEIRDTYAGTLEEPAAGEYSAAFNFAVFRRMPRFALELEDEA